MRAIPPDAITEYTLDADTGATSAPRVEPFAFTGTGGGYFRVWIVNLLLSILTLGIFSAWAKVRRLRYFYRHTRLAGSAFEYHGRGLQILKGRLLVFGVLAALLVSMTMWPLAGLLFAVVLLLATPWTIVRMRAYQARMSAWRNVRFDFPREYGEATRIYIVLAMLISLTLGLVYPYWRFRRYEFAITNTSFGRTPFGFTAKPAGFYRIYLVALLFWIPVLWGLFLLAGSYPVSGDPVDVEQLSRAIPLVVLSIVLPFLLGMSYLEKALTNAALGAIIIGPHRLLSYLRMGPLFRIYLVNTLLVALTLGLFVPFAQVRLARYRLGALSLEVHGGLEAFIADQPSQAATGPVLGDFLDIAR